MYGGIKTANSKPYKGGQCQHDDCKYRSSFSGRGLHFCDYLCRENVPRGCPADQCDKYMPKGRKRRRGKDMLINPAQVMEYRKRGKK